MGRPTQRQVEEGRGFQHEDEQGRKFWVADTFSEPVLGVGVANRQAILDRDAVADLADFLDRWLLQYPEE